MVAEPGTQGNLIIDRALHDAVQVRRSAASAIAAGATFEMPLLLFAGFLKERPWSHQCVIFGLSAIRVQ